MVDSEQMDMKHTHDPIWKRPCLADDRAEGRGVAGAAEHASGAQEVRAAKGRPKVHLRQIKRFTLCS